MHFCCRIGTLSTRKIMHGVVLGSVLGVALPTSGCANPGPPRPPSLRLPQPVHDLTAERIGDHVELHFTAPSRTTDKLPLRGSFVTGAICRGLEHLSCAASSPKTNVALNSKSSSHELTTWEDKLSPDLATGEPRLLAYRVEFFNADGKSAGKSDAAYTVAGAAPQPVDSLQAHGSRLGVILNWAAAPMGDDSVVIKREDRRPAKETTPKDKSVWLAANASGNATSTLDTSALPNIPYRYTVVRRRIVRLGGRSIELRSDAATAPVFTLHEVYAPPVPTDVTAAGFSEDRGAGQAAKFAVDLIWQPVDEAGLITKLAGYNVYREQMDAASKPNGQPTRLNTASVPQPSFRDDTASASVRYRYSVSAVDIKGNESKGASVILEPTAAP
jgi:hypothetical protein